MLRFAVTILSLLLLALPAWSDDIGAARVREPVEKLLSPDASVWTSVPETRVMVLPQTVTVPRLSKGIFTNLFVKAVHNGKWLALLLVWEDDTRDAQVAGGLFTDAAAVQFPLNKSNKVNPFMGSAEDAVQIVHWKAIWQDDVEHGYRDVEQAYPNLYYDFYPLAKSHRAEDQNINYVTARAAGNPISQIDRSQPCEELIAKGFGTLTTQERNDAQAWGVHRDGKWRVVIARPLATRDQSDCQLAAGETVPVAFALWDGATENRGALKHYSMWINLVLEGAAR